MDIYTLLDERHSDVDEVFKWLDHEKTHPADAHVPHDGEEHHFWDDLIPADNL